MEAESAIFEYIEVFYNRQRKHSHSKRIIEIQYCMTKVIQPNQQITRLIRVVE